MQLVGIVVSLSLAVSAMAGGMRYPWLSRCDPSQALAVRIAPPNGCQRVAVQAGSFGHWLRDLPLKPGRPPVRLHDGALKANQSAHVAVVDIDTGRRNLQQCADAVMRLRAEYLHSAGQHGAIHFNFTSSHRADYTRWAAGYRPVIRGSSVRWARSSRADASRAGFRRYLDCVFTYAGTASLSWELRAVPRAADVQPGDVFIKGGFPGHAVLVVDVAVRSGTGESVFLLAQSYMPAQDIHMLRNPCDGALSPWYAVPSDGTLRTPEWTFTCDQLKRFP